MHESVDAVESKEQGQGDGACQAERYDPRASLAWGDEASLSVLSVSPYGGSVGFC